MSTEPRKRHSLSEPILRVQNWSIPLQEIYSNKTFRLDAPHYARESSQAVIDLKKSGYPLKQLSELADIILPGQFKRIWAQSSEHGYRYVNGSELISIAGMGAIEKTPRYLSKITKTNINALLLKENTLLVTCSGTIGRIIYVSKRFKGWAATHDLIRIIPKTPNILGYLYAYLSSSVAQAQIVGHTHGGQIDHVTAHQLMTILVPIPPENKMKKIHDTTLETLIARDNSAAALVDITNDLEKIILVK